MRIRWFGFRPVVLVVVAGLALSCATPQTPDFAVPDPSPGARGLVVIAHGVDAHGGGWPVVVARSLAALDTRSQWDIYAPDWYEESLDPLAAPRRGYALGQGIGQAIAAMAGRYEVIHLIGHSAGAHVIQGIVDAMRAQGDTTVVFCTFLDPFVFRTLVQWHWGVRNLGLSSDFAECYVTRKDHLPFTNSLLDHAHNVDLTDILPTEEDAPRNFAHMWPILYYIAPAGSAGAGSGQTVPAGEEPVAGVARSPLVRLGDEVTAGAAAELAAKSQAAMPAGVVEEPAPRETQPYAALNPAYRTGR